MLADGYRMRAAELQARAEALRGEPGEADVLEEAREHLSRRSTSTTRSAATPTSRQPADAERQLQAIEDRLLEISS